MANGDLEVTDKEREAFMYMLRDSGRENYPLNVSWCVSFEGERGNTCSMWGVVKWVDPKARRVQLANQASSQWIEMEKIINVHV
ncbi:YolD-like family protein [Brevibacillus brevis]|uniref:YolD-like family protein n=1 Tax=Brevibacillus brevis TaxID=1393 RepID=A0A517I4W3_BREBE|nr:YolD-like family protein [Brevibacillus brevis]QDS33937.1 YolD-like family protein [Brevibacillus brevis]